VFVNCKEKRWRKLPVGLLFFWGKAWLAVLDGTRETHPGLVCLHWEGDSVFYSLPTFAFSSPVTVGSFLCNFSEVWAPLQIIFYEQTTSPCIGPRALLT
jgi:hypothetical protein